MVAMKQLGLGLNLSTKNAEGERDPEMKQAKKATSGTSA
jgi:hypothetical protein